MALRLKANRRFPSVPVVTDDPKNHTQVLMGIKEALDIGQRRTGDLLNSFIRVEDLIDLGLITIEGNTTSIVGADLSEIANIGDLSGSAIGDFLRFNGTDWVNGQLSVGDITQAMVVQHQAALAIDWSQLTGTPPGLADLSDVLISLPAIGDSIHWDGYDWVNALPVRRPPGATWVRAGSAIATPVNDVSVYFSEAAYITGVVVLCKTAPGDCVIDIWKDTYANYPPAVGDTICGGSKPTITGGIKYQDFALAGWTRDIAAGDTITFHLQSAATFEVIHIYLLTRPAL
jgi:hypothetical protein